MIHDYYYYNKEQLLKNPKIPIVTMDDNELIFESMAKEMVEEIERKNKAGEKTVFITPVGPVGQYPYFVSLINEKKVSLKDVWFICMDEYLDEKKQWISKEDRLSFRGFMDRNVYGKINLELVMSKDQRVFPDPNNINYIPNLIKELGGVDIAFGGIGINGHVAFNEPQDKLSKEEFMELPTRVMEIAHETRVVNSIGDLNGAYEDMPKYCVTIGFHEISNARKIRLGCFRDWHRAVIRKAAYGESTSSFPITLLQDHEDINIKISEFVANLPE